MLLPPTEVPGPFKLEARRGNRQTRASPLNAGRPVRSARPHLGAFTDRDVAPCWPVRPFRRGEVACHSMSCRGECQPRTSPKDPGLRDLRKLPHGGSFHAVEIKRHERFYIRLSHVVFIQCFKIKEGYADDPSGLKQIHKDASLPPPFCELKSHRAGLPNSKGGIPA